MGVKASSHVWEHSKQKGAALLLLLAIADHADDNGEAYPSIPRLARKCRCSIRYVQLMVEKLIEEGELIVDTVGGAKTRNGHTNLYCIVGVNPNSRVVDRSPHLRVKHGSPLNDSSPVGVKDSSPQEVNNDSPQEVKDSSPLTISSNHQRKQDIHIVNGNGVVDPPPTLAFFDGQELEKEWAMMLQELQLTMPRSTFDSWLAGSRLFACGEHGTSKVFRLILTKHYGVDWVINRMATQIKRMIQQIILKGKTSVILEVKSQEGSPHD